jgi:hypothetical protein
MGNRRCNLPIDNARGRSEPDEPQNSRAFRVTMAEQLSRVLFGVALLIGSFAYGAVVVRYEVFPPRLHLLTSLAR